MNASGIVIKLGTSDVSLQNARWLSICQVWAHLLPQLLKGKQKGEWVHENAQWVTFESVCEYVCWWQGGGPHDDPTTCPDC